MNRTTILLFSLLISMSCSKPKDNNDNSPAGKWTYIENYYSTGGAGEWHPVHPAGQVIEFKADGSFLPAPSFLSNATSYQVLDSTRVKFQPATTPTGSILMKYDITSAPGFLLLTPVEPACIEGCASKFSRYSGK